MKKIKLEIGAVIMMAAAFITDRAEIILIYALAASIHETGHLLAARVLHIPIKEIRFGFSGIRICTDDVITSYKKEILFAFAGPLANLACMSICTIIMQVIDIPFFELLYSADNFLDGEGRTGIGALGFFFISSFLHCFVNLFPINTFDGGRIMFCSVASLISERAGERVIEVTTAISALIIWIIALYLLLKVASGMGIFVFAACIFFSTMFKRSEA